MRSVNVTVRVDEDMKRDFDSFCENVGMNVTTAINMFMRATLRTRELPFIVTDTESPKQKRDAILARGREAMGKAQEISLANGNSEMTPDEINAIISECRKEMRAEQ